jgi:hypothetical protein
MAGIFLLQKRYPTLLNGGAKFPKQLLVIVIWGDDRSNFKVDPDRVYMNKIVKLAGKSQRIITRHK